MPNPADPTQHSVDAATASNGRGMGLGPFAALVTMIGAVAASLVLVMTPHFEGTVNAGYRDIAGVVTACTGHTLTAQLGRTYTDDECRELLAKDLASHARPVLRCLRVPVEPHTMAALVDWAFNVGPAAVCGSGAMRLINAGRLAEGCAQILRWVYVRQPNGRLVDCRQAEHRCAGIPKRREAQAALCAAPPTGHEPHLRGPRAS